LVTEAGGLPPGRALDVGCGEGGDSVWLARRGWQVTGVDISGTALERARKHAEAAGDDVAARITWIRADITSFIPEPSQFDLVSTHFLPLPGDRRDEIHLRLARSVAPGGTLLLVAHDPTDVAMATRMPQIAEFFAAAGPMAGALPAAGWDVEAAEARPRTVDDPEGGQMTIHDAVVVARRTVAAPSGE
jgi:SAM-dependent methyltransferase